MPWWPMRTRRRGERRAEPERPSVGSSVFAGCKFSGGIGVYIYGMPVSRGVRHALDLRRVLATARDVGLVIVPNEGGQARAFVLAATPAVREWVEDGLRSESPPWLIDNQATGGQ